MKKIITLALLFPFVSLAAGVTIDDVIVSGGNATVQGTAQYDPAIPAIVDEETEEVITPEVPAVDTLTVQHDGSTVLSAQNLNPWSISFQAKPGTHEVTATVGGITAVSSYRLVLGGGILNQLGNYCGFLSGQGFMNCSQQVFTRIIPFGQEGCMFAWGCKGN